MQNYLTASQNKVKSSAKQVQRISAYMLWAKITYPRVQQQNPGLCQEDINEKLADLWTNSVGLAEKEEWKRKARRLEEKNFGLVINSEGECIKQLKGCLI